MANLHTVLNNLKTELGNQIELIVPHRAIDPKYKFEQFTIDSANKTLYSATCDPRTFQIMDFIVEGPFAFGGSHRSTVGNLEIHFAYPHTTAWEMAAHDDMMQIDTFLLRNPSSVTGVSGRWCNPEVPTRSEASVDDARRIYVLTVRCHLETTF